MIANPLNSSELVFPILECLHILGFSLSIGTIAIVDFALLGIGLRQPPAEIAKQLSLWTAIGLSLMLFTGLLLFSSDPDSYYLNWPFLIKMALFLSAVIYHYTRHRKAVARGQRSAASISLALWGGVVFGGIFIGFVYPGLTTGRF